LKPEDISANGIRTCIIDLAIAVDHITLAATELRLANCWIGAFDQDATKKVLQIPEQYEVMALLPVGYAADSPGPKKRKTLSEITSFDIF
jgi:nitroreductase